MDPARRGGYRVSPTRRDVVAADAYPLHTDHQGPPNGGAIVVMESDDGLPATGRV
jgi:hypothetical protein